ncbi:two-component sensor histidine kinase [Paenibacillus sp. HJL G12]|uniref:Two-component sensor histidine kinase n=1 Tax=Paenibacillus dendrobii TaxID=2691084 RepID=A0A7X3IFF9_9BACL|nr:histidine kinase [Paenibacillus dendrobii]MWV42918.1 two-component sensor histidine kinase [Paenibacillus dendrobii]
MKLQAAGKSSKWFVYQKIVIVFILFLLPLISMNIWLNYKGMSITKHAILNSSLAGASFYSKQLDKEMFFIRNLQLQLLNDKDLQKLSFRGSMLENYEEVELIDQVRDRLSTLMVSSEYVVSTGVYVEAVGKTISTASGVTNTPNGEMKLISSLMKEKPKPSFYRSGNRIFLIETENNGGIWSYIEISRPKLLEALKEIAKLYPESEVLLGNKELGTVLTTANKMKESNEVLYLTEDKSMHDPNAPEMKKINGVSYFIVQNDVSSLHLSLLMYVNENEITRPLSQFITWFYTLFIIAIIVMVLYSFSVNLMIHRPLSKLVKAFHMIETDNLNIMIDSKTKDEFHYVFNSFNNMTRKLKNSIEENYEQKIALQHSQLKQLQSQINPHFLYNSFFNIYMMCKVGDSDSAAELSQKLGSYYQYITRSGADEVPFYKEYRHALDYCDIQCIRFSNRIAYEYEGISGVPPSISVPRLIIQPIVENVFEHAFEDGMMEGMIYISTDYREGRLRVTVEDNGNLATDEVVEHLREKLVMDSKYIEKTGLINVNNRLQLKYGLGSGVFISRSEYGGLKVELIIMDQKEGA